MAVDLKTSVSKEINQINKSIVRARSQLESLRDELKRHENIYEMLGGGRKRNAGVKSQRGRRATVNWSSVLRGLPGTFTVDAMSRKSAVRRKPRAYLRQVVVRWVKEGKIKRTKRGVYQKV
jgi:hypothetical protein